jgi:hypothetical protein
VTIPNTIFKVFMPDLVCSREEGTNRPRIEGIASSTITDSHGDEITIAGQRKMVASAMGLTVFMNHEYRVPQDVFGTVTKARLIATDVTDKKTGKPVYDMRWAIDVADSNPLAMQTFDLLEKNKSHLGISIGAMIPEGGASINKETKGLIVDDIDIVEGSIVGVPASPRSFVDYAVKSITGRFPEKVDRPSFLAKMATEAAGEEVTETSDDEDEVEKVSKALDEIATGTPATDDESEETTNEDPTVVEKSKISIWETDEGKTVEIDTGRSKPKADDSQSEQAKPDTSGGSTSGAKAKSGDVTVITAAKSALDNSGSLVTSLVAQLRASRTENADLKEQIKQLTEISTSAIRNATAYIERVGQLPAGRQTGYIEAKAEMTDLASVYGDDVRAILRKAQTKVDRGSNAVHD